MPNRPTASISADLRHRIVRSPRVRRRLHEHVFPQPAAERQLRGDLGRVPVGAGSYAVLGCGIGWLAWELASHHRRAEVVGFDPDSTSIDVATILFDRPNLSFAVGPGDGDALDRFDVLVVESGTDLLPPTNSQADKRIVMLGGPPRRIGEDATGDYDRSRQGDTRRSDRVAARLGIHVTATGYLVARQPGLNVLVAMPERGGYSETFIRAHVERLPANVSLLMGSMQNMTDEDGREVVPWIGRKSRGLIGRLFGTRTARRLDRFWLRRHVVARRIDVILAEYGPRGVQMISVCERARIPLVTHFHGYDGTARTVFQKYRRGYRRLFQRGDPLVVVSQHMASRLIGIGADPATLHVIPAGVDPEPGNDMPRFGDPPVFLAVGRFVEKKAPHLTILAFAALVRDVPEARLKMVGDGPLVGPCRQLVPDLRIEDKVEFLGVLPHEQLPAMYRESRAFVQHSMEAQTGDTEGLPVAILEAGAAGLPVVATRHAGIPEALIDGETGYLVPEGGLDEMADRLRTLAGDRQLAERLGSAARRRVTANFALDDTLARLRGVLESAVAGSVNDASGRRRDKTGR
jgi:glycosyltransferase involved in cell wall biosynthesis